MLYARFVINCPRVRGPSTPVLSNELRVSSVPGPSLRTLSTQSVKECSLHAYLFKCVRRFNATCQQHRSTHDKDVDSAYLQLERIQLILAVP